MLRLEINIGTSKKPDWQAAWLGDESINMQYVNPVFDTSAGGAFSEEFELDCEMNRHIVGNVDELDGMSVFKRLYGKRFRLSFDGVPVMYGIVRLDKEVEMEDGKVSIELASANREWDELLEGKGLQDLDFIEKEEHRVPIGYCFGDYPALEYKYQDLVIVKDYDIEKRKLLLDSHGDEETTVNTYVGEVTKSDEEKTGYLYGISLPKMMFPVLPDTECVNTSSPYDPITKQHKYCNIRTCSQKYTKKSESSGSSESWEAARDYNVKEADYTNSAPCFYVGYILDRVIEALKISADLTELENITDFYRLAIVHSNCGFTYQDNNGETIQTLDRFYEEGVYEDLKEKVPNDMKPQLAFINNYVRIYFKGDLTNKGEWSVVYFGTKGVEWPGYIGKNDPDYIQAVCGVCIVQEQNGTKQDIHFRKYQSIKIDESALKRVKAFATAENLPDIGFDEFIAGIRDMFGLRFIYNAQSGSVKVVSLKNILTEEVYSELPAYVNQSTCTQEHIRGFHLKYNASSEYKANAITGMLHYTQGADDTTYNYYDYRRAVVFGQKASSQQTVGENIPLSYKNLLQTKSDTNMNFYIDEMTGNGYRFKVDAEAKDNKSWYPSLFEVGAFRDVIIGDCNDEELTETISIGCTPAILNDVNGKAEFNERFGARQNEEHAVADAAPVAFPSYALFVDGETHVEMDTNLDPTGKDCTQEYKYEDFAIDQYYDHEGVLRSSTSVNIAITTGAQLNWDYTKQEMFTDEECSFMLAVMRGSGSDAYRTIIQSDYDGEGNDYWAQVAGGQGQTTSDSVDTCGGWYDYNGVDEGLGYEKVDIKYTSKTILKDQGETCFQEYFKDSEITYNNLIRDSIVAPKTNISTNNRYYIILSTGIKSVGVYSTKAEAEAWLKVLNKLIELRDSDIDSVTIEYPTVTMVMRKPLSLKLKAEKPYKGGVKQLDENGKEYLITDFLSDKRPVYNEDGEKTGEEDAYYPIDTAYAKRGIFDQFYTEYAHFVLNRKIVKMKVEMELATLLNIDMTKKYKIGDVVGWIKQYSYTLDMEKGLSNVEVEMYYL